MSFSINIYGGTQLIMMGHSARSESLFYYFRIEDHVPEDHLLRLVDRHIDFAFVRGTLKASYSHIGRPSIRNKIEALFSELRNQIRLRKVRLRGLRNAKEQFYVSRNGPERETAGEVSEPCTYL
jgi:hypothetical protein